MLLYPETLFMKIELFFIKLCCLISAPYNGGIIKSILS